MTREERATDGHEPRPNDPYGIDLPTGWSARRCDRATVYENDRGDHRVRIVEFSKGLTLYWWVDVFVDDDGWERREVGLGESYTDPDGAVAAVESYLAAAVDGGTDHHGSDRREASVEESDFFSLPLEGTRMSNSRGVDLRRILVPTNGSEGAAAALEHAITVATATDAEILLLAVVDPYGMSTVTERSEIEAELEDVVTDAAAKVQDAGVAVSTAFEVGFPHEEILTAVENHAIDLIAMGTHGRSGLQRYVLGSVAEKVVRLSPVPVLTVRVDAAGERPYRDIVVPTDGSDAAAPAERFGVDLADELGAAVHALSVVPEGPVRSSETRSAYEEIARTAIERVSSRGTEVGIDVAEAIEHGVPHRTIIDHCTDVGADLVVLGTHGRTGVERYVLGSVAEKVVRLSETPVLVVPSK